MARLSAPISEARVLPPRCSASRSPRRMSPRSMLKVAILPITLSVASKPSSGTVFLGMRTRLTCWASIIWPKGISTVATTTLCRLSSGPALSRALSQLLAIQAAPSPRIRDRATRVRVRALMSVSP
ncbi:hypothetical protein D3C85_1468520 [compost metagenome]